MGRADGIGNIYQIEIQFEFNNNITLEHVRGSFRKMTWKPWGDAFKIDTWKLTLSNFITENSNL